MYALSALTIIQTKIQGMQNSCFVALTPEKNLHRPLYTVQTANQSNLPWLSAHPSIQMFCAILLTNKLTHQEGMKTTLGIHFS